MRYGSTRPMRFVAGLVACALLLGGCALGRPVRPADGASPTPPVPAKQPVTAAAARNLVLQQSEMVAYRKAVEAKGWRLDVRSEETPTRFIVNVGEDQGDHQVHSYWYLVNKATGAVTEWDITKGAPPTD